MSTYQSQPSVIVSNWLDAPFHVNEETVFVVGDVHGCTDHLSALLERIEAEAEGLYAPRLVLLGDLICRGPNSLGALARWSAPHLDSSFKQVNPGNHEQLLMLSIGGGELAEAANAIDPISSAIARPYRYSVCCGARGASSTKKSLNRNFRGAD
jgi:hypothetical protein